MFPFYMFIAALIVFLLYNYRQVIKEKLGYNDNDADFSQSVKNLQLELRGTADAIIEQFEKEHERMEIALAKATEQIAELERLLQIAESIPRRAADEPVFPSVPEEEKSENVKSDGNTRPEDQRIRIVSQMAKDGMDIYEISQATGLGYSEVRLLLNIGRKEPSVGNREPGTGNREND